MPRVLTYHSVETPLGCLLLVADDDGLISSSFTTDPEASLQAFKKRGTVLQPLSEPHTGERQNARPSEVTIRSSCSQLKRYFGGEFFSLMHVPCAPRGTDFQKLVWSELKKIRPGKTLSYSELAHKLGKPRALRAAAAACAANPVVLFIPCHRVIAKDGSLGGFSAGVEKKSFLLELEGAGEKLAKCLPGTLD